MTATDGEIERRCTQFAGATSKRSAKIVEECIRSRAVVPDI